ncbi:MAG: ketoacyl-ACP synthase III [Treponema sp.]|jgi:3-oxoacyl-[acyl-carrier-protein] synthase-3|nr:ketoacyl-ACP synthase III [Treponema sp.]
MAIEIIATGRSVPERRITNEDLAKKIDTSDEWIRSHTGIGSRHIADENTATSDLGAAAALEALKMAIKRGAVSEKSPVHSTEQAQHRRCVASEGSPLEELVLTVDFIVLGTSTPDYYCCPPTSCIVQHILGAKNAASMDITAACSGFIYGMETAAALLNADSRRKRALVIGVDLLSRVTDWDDRSTCVLFGDGAGAVLLEKTASQNEAGKSTRGLLRTILKADGSGWEHLIARRGVSRAPWKKGETIEKSSVITMNGQAVYNFAVGAITEILDRMMNEEKIGIQDLALIIPHQANARIVQAAGKRLKIPEEKLYLNIEEYANTSSASIPIALDELNRSGALKKGDLIMTVGFGAGLTYGGNLIRW